MVRYETASCRLPTSFGEFTLTAFRVDGEEHLALSMGRLDDGAPVLARIHSQCLTGEALGSVRCDCGAQLEAALHAIGAERRGVLVYLRQEGRGIGLFNKVRTYALQDGGADTMDANLRLGFADDARTYGAAVRILRSLGIGAVRLMTNNPRKLRALAEGGIDVQRVPLVASAHPASAAYLRTKARRMGHLLGGLATAAWA